MNTIRLRLALVIALVAITLSIALMPALAHAPGSTQEGWFSVLHWVPRPGSQDIAKNIYLLSLDDGHTLQLDIAPDVLAAAGGFTRLKNRRVAVTLDAATPFSPQESVSHVRALRIGVAPIPFNVPQGALSRAVSGSQSWVTIMCAFPGSVVGQDTDTLPYFQDMYSAEYPGMDHYWRQQSFGKVNLLGSNAFGWFTLPKAQTEYIPEPGQGGDGDFLLPLAEDCIDAADSAVDFSPYVGINFMFNGELDCCAWGGGSFLAIDGATKLWRLTWNPPWSWRDITVVAHEVGHGFGLPHANNYDNDGFPYDSPWDVMSDTFSFCSKLNDPDYGCLGQHTSAYHKDQLGWFAPAQRLQVAGNTGEITLDHIAMQNPDNLQVVIIPVSGSSVFYTVEARQTNSANYDAKLPGKAVIIHEIDETRIEPAWLVGGTTDAKSKSVNNDPDNPDAAWLPGESFVGPNFTVNVISETTNGFVISVEYDGPTPTATPTSEPTATPTVTPTPRPGTELVENGGFELKDGTGSADLTPWTVKNPTSDKIKCNKSKIIALAGACAFQFKGGVGENSKLVQTVDLTGITLVSGDTLDLLVYTNTNIADAGKLKLRVKYTDTTPTGKITESVLANGVYNSINQTLVIGSSAVSKIKVQIDFKGASGKLYVDVVSLSLIEGAGVRSREIGLP
jgi:M6 family metalloprotease-like protein